MIIGIEGTGSQSWGQPDLTRTFVRRILDQTALGPKVYFIGPSNGGSDGSTIIDGVMKVLGQFGSASLVLVGYSRGAAYCMEVARRLGTPVKAMIMFDAVARQPDFAIPENVPGNVGTCFHAIRNPKSGSRYSFQNVGLHHDKGNMVFQRRYFFGSHGAMGGVSWNAQADESGDGALNATFDVDDRQLLNIPHQPTTDLAQDEAAAQQVAGWMWPLMSDLGVVPKAANPYMYAPAFTGSRKPGIPNYV
jgi:pimeloyl-ACP methyl ester carboxylesterase